MTKLSRSFYTDTDTLKIAQNLLGKVLCTNIQGDYTSGIISETEAYLGIQDKASHAFGGKRTKRTEIMYSSGGLSYVYLCYGIHHLFNVVTHLENMPHAILIRNIIPLEGIEIMQKRRKRKSAKNFLTGPGTMSQALGITTKLNGVSLQGDTIWIENRGTLVRPEEVKISPRIGIDYAGEDAKLPYRFLLNTKP